MWQRGKVCKGRYFSCHELELSPLALRELGSLLFYDQQQQHGANPPSLPAHATQRHSYNAARLASDCSCTNLQPGKLPHEFLQVMSHSCHIGPAVPCAIVVVLLIGMVVAMVVVVVRRVSASSSSSSSCALVAVVSGWCAR